VLAACLAASAAVPLPGAGAVNLGNAQKRLEQAQAELDQLGKEIPREQARVDALQASVEGLKGEISLAQAEYDRIVLQLRQTQEELAQTQENYDGVKAEIDARARVTYMAGPGSGLDLILGATSMSDLSDRVEFIGAIQAQDADRAAELTSLATQLNDSRRRQTDLMRVKKGALDVFEQRQQELSTREAEAAAALADLQAKQAEAERLVEKYKHKIQVYWKSMGGGGPSPFDVCPVPEHTWIANDFGAIRYTTIPPHSHAGNDIGAPYGSPIVAPFAGDASNASNGLGGTAVYVRSSAGYVYNAHLSKLGQLGSVQAGDIIGYIGMSGDAQGTVPHDHFEWHPNSGDAVDPYAYLMAVC